MWHLHVVHNSVDFTLRESVDGVQGAQREDSAGKVQDFLEGDQKRTGFEAK